ncbi:MAG: ABC transporter permease [Acidobacteriota bacterium]
MSHPPLAIDYWQLAIGLLFIAVAGVASAIHGLGLGRDLLVGTVRTFAQLFLMGYALAIIFQVQSPWLVVGIFCCMIAFAAWIIRGRVHEPSVHFFFPTLASMLISYVLVTGVVTGAVIGAEPWWSPRYFIPIGGMVVGNSMSAIAVSLERLFSDLRKRRDEVEMMLCLGADYREASHRILQDAIKAGMIPSINSMMGVGIVFIPGMMTGQILGGTDPMLAIRYQIVVMLMLVGSTAIGSLIVTLWIRRLSFDSSHRLLLRHEEGNR